MSILFLHGYAAEANPPTGTDLMRDPNTGKMIPTRRTPRASLTCHDRRRGLLGGRMGCQAPPFRSGLDPRCPRSRHGFETVTCMTLTSSMLTVPRCSVYAPTMRLTAQRAFRLGSGKGRRNQPRISWDGPAVRWRLRGPGFRATLGAVRGSRDSATGSAGSAPKMPRTRSGLPHWSQVPELRHRVRTAPALALALDVDGTLAPVTPSPQETRVPPPTQEAVAALIARRDVLAAAVSGRRLSELRTLVPLPGLLLCAEYGLVVADGASIEEHPAAAGARAALKEAQRRLEALSRGVAGAWVEEKDADIVLHFRRADEASAASLADAAQAALRDLAGAAGPLQTQLARKAVEVRPAGAPDKGEALRRLLRRKADALPLFVGDDVGDEDGFAEAERLGGLGVWVASDEVTSDETWAQCALRDPDDVRSWLIELVAIREAEWGREER